jgi:hypothetical protein
MKNCISRDVLFIGTRFSNPYTLVYTRIYIHTLLNAMRFPRTGVGFGAGVLLDSKDNFFIIGGVDSTLSERGELYVFQLQDPFYKHCSATGAALTSARAGVTSVFYIQCMDNFMEPANGATFKVDIAGPVGMIPGILSLGDGKYSCSYTPEKVGAYVISIYVGRGGTKYQDLITGRDIETSNNVHEFEKQCNYINGAQECKSSQARPVQDPMQNSTARAIIMKCAHTHIHSYVWHLRVSVFSHSHVNALAEPLCANCRAGYHERSCNYCSGHFSNPYHGGDCI